jgi:hypothetical protein
VGYKTQTFGPAPTLGSSWLPCNFYGLNQPSDYATQDVGGTLYLSGASADSYGATVCSATPDSTNPHGWSGTAFGGGGYFEAVFSFTGAATIEYEDALAFWANDIEEMSQGYDTSWEGMASNYQDWIEVDIMEFDASTLTQYGTSLHNWYGVAGAGTKTDLPVGSPAQAANNWSNMNKYGMLWVPATATTQGYIKFFYNDVQVGTTGYWNQYDIANPPPPNASSTGSSPLSAGSVLDLRHLALILGTNSQAPMTVQSVSVWQASSANNITH